ncbi:MAG: hypothetical protein AAGC78_14885 [Cellvibrio sp.]
MDNTVTTRTRPEMHITDPAPGEPTDPLRKSVKLILRAIHSQIKPIGI